VTGATPALVYLGAWSLRQRDDAQVQ